MITYESKKGLIEIDALKDHDKAAALHFLNEGFGEHRTMEDFESRTLKNEFGQGLFVVAKAKGKIVGTQGLLVYDFKDSSQKIIKSGKSEDTLVDPNYRGIDLSVKLYEKLSLLAKQNGVQFIWGFSHLRNSFFNKSGFNVTNHIDIYAFNNSRINSIKFLIYSNLWNFKKRLRIFLKIRNNNKSEKIKIEIKEIKKEDYFKKELGFNIIKSVNFNKSVFNKHQFYAVFNLNKELIAKLTVDHTYKNVVFISELNIFKSINSNLINQLLNELSHRYGLLLFWAFSMKSMHPVNKLLLEGGMHLFKKGHNICWKNIGERSYKPDEFYFSRLLAFHL